MFEKHFGMSSTVGFSSGQSSAAVENYNQVFREGKNSQKGIQSFRDYNVSIDGKRFFESRIEQRMETAYQNGFDKGRWSELNGPFYQEGFVIDFGGKITRGNITFDFVETVEGTSFDSYEDGESLVGYSFPDDSLIEIKKGLRARKMDKICNHEMLHLMFPNFSHPKGDAKFDDPIFTLDEKIDLRICNSIVKRAVQRSSS